MRVKEVNRFSKPIVEPLFYVLMGTSILCTSLIVVRAIVLDNRLYEYLLWNLFLAWLPLIVSMSALFLARHLRGSSLVISLTLFGVVWLLLYPNAPYLTTDFIHLIFSPSYEGYREDGLLLWYDLVMFFLFSWCGLLLGYVSMRHFHSLVSHYFNDLSGWVFVLVVSFLGGFGVYLGRVMRLNSWDVVFSPFRLIESVIEWINPNSAVFSVLFGTLILIVYLSLFLLGNNRSGDNKKSA
jgi:uncharacterized membrane protein